MVGLLTDVNVQDHRDYLLAILDHRNLRNELEHLPVRLLTFADVELDPKVKDDVLWRFCQDVGLVLYTHDRRRVGDNSLQAVLDRLAGPDCLPVLTVGDGERFRHSATYAERVALSVADILFGIVVGNEYRGVPRLYLPTASYPEP